MYRNGFANACSRNVVVWLNIMLVIVETTIVKVFDNLQVVCILSPTGRFRSWKGKIVVFQWLRTVASLTVEVEVPASSADANSCLV
jgi:hypothetical protein